MRQFEIVYAEFMAARRVAFLSRHKDTREALDDRDLRNSLQMELMEIDPSRMAGIDLDRLPYAAGY